MMTRRTLLAAAALSPSLPRLMAATSTLGVVELRSYATTPGRRDELISMFEAHFLDAYERAGARILGTFRHLDDPDRWVWMRAFPSRAAREEALRGFYGSATWRSRADACNATIADVSNARLLAPVAGEVWASPPRSPALGAGSGPAAVFELVLHELEPGGGAGFLAWSSEAALPLIDRLGGSTLGTLSTQPGMDTDPKRPVLAGSYVVLLRRFESVAVRQATLEARAASDEWRALEERIASKTLAPAERWWLQPTSRSAFR